MKQTIFIDTEKIVLSGECRVHKTESFIKETHNFSDADLFFSKAAGGVILQAEKIRSQLKSAKQQSNTFGCCKLQTEDKAHTIYFSFGWQIKSKTPATQNDIVFFRYSGKENLVRRGDQTLAALLNDKSFNLILESVSFVQSEPDFQKLYRLSYSPHINFPFLNEPQRQITAIEDQNVLVQGVAGSGKTNICIDKIIFAACRSYGGRILYSTFSRGLLTDTQSKIKHFQNNLKAFVEEYSQGKIVFADSNHKRAVENQLGIYFPADSTDEICEKVKRVDAFLDTNIDYMMLEDFYVKHISSSQTFVGESFFVKNFVKNLKNHQLISRLEKSSNLSHEVIFKEIYGVIFGCYDMTSPVDIMPFQEYAERRKDSFNKQECEIIYWLAKEYDAYLKKNNLADNNLISRRLLTKSDAIKKYSLAVLDEVQDMTEVNLCFVRSVCRKMFCVGDALQMINPSYFSFAYLKRLLYEKDIASVAELSSNYRNTKRIADIIEELGKINVKQFGTHSFVLKTTGIESETPTSLVYAEGNDFVSLAAKEKFNNYTVIVPSVEEKERLRKLFAKQEILTVAEIKGLERDVVVLYNVLSANLDKWKQLERLTVNRKEADENSVYRYYFNLFYVGISRGKTHVYVCEEQNVPQFKQFFDVNFQRMSAAEAVADLLDTSDKSEIEQDEIVSRIEEFIKLGQFDNARFAADKILSSQEKDNLHNRINVFADFVSHGRYREAGVRFWELGMIDEARNQFELAGEEMLCRLLDACGLSDSKGLDIDILDFLPDVQNNGPAIKLILEVVKKDYEKLTERQNTINRGLVKLRKGEING